MAQLVNRGLDASASTVLLPGVMGDAILQGQGTASIARITSEDRARGDVTLFEVTPKQAHTFRRSGQHHRSLPLALPKDADLLIILRQVHFCRQEAKCLPDTNSRFIQQGKKGSITQIGDRNSPKNLRHRFRRERTRFTLDLLNGIETFHRIRLDHLMTNKPMVKGTKSAVAPSSCRGTQMVEAGEKSLNRFSSHRW